MTTTLEIANRALQLLGFKKNLLFLTQDSVEAKTLGIALGPIQNWCFGLSNWNFARTTASLTIAKGPPPANPGAWSNTYPSPPWLYEYTLPSDFIRAIYLTNNDPGSTAGFLGEPKRFVIANDTISAVEQMVLLTNEPACNLIYTAFISNPSAWPWYFERLAVIALAQTVCLVLTNSMQLLAELTQSLEQQISIATQINQLEGLVIPDSTPELIQALGINYPYRRIDDKSSAPAMPSRSQPKAQQ